MPKLEKVAEQKFARELKRDYNIRAIKFNDPARRGAPDRLVILPKGLCVFIEFKRPGESLKAEQRAYRSWLVSLGHIVYLCTSADEAYGLVESHLDFREV